MTSEEVADVLHAFKQNGRPVNIDKFNFLSGGKKLKDVSKLEDCAKGDTVTVLVTLAQNIADPDIMKIVKGTQEKPEEKKKIQEDTTPKKISPKKPGFVCQDLSERNMFTKLLGLGFGEESIGAALLRLRYENAEYRAKLKEEELLNMAIDFINAYQSPDTSGKIWSPSPNKKEEKKSPVLDLSTAKRSTPPQRTSPKQPV